MYVCEMLKRRFAKRHIFSSSTLRFISENSCTRAVFFKCFSVSFPTSHHSKSLLSFFPPRSLPLEILIPHCICYIFCIYFRILYALIVRFFLPCSFSPKNQFHALGSNITLSRMHGLEGRTLE